MNELQIILATLNPLVTKLQSLEDKVDKLSNDRATRSDIEKLRNELVALFVPRESYEERHQSLVATNNNLENSIKNNKLDILDIIRVQEEEMKKVEAKFVKMIEENKASELSSKERLWVRWAYISGFISVGFAVVEAVIQHVKIS